MALKNFGFLFTGPGLDPAHHVAVIQHGAFKCTVVGMSAPEQGLAVATHLVAQGVELIELCGGFGPVWTAKILQCVEGKVPVGSVAYGPESIQGMAALFPD